MAYFRILREVHIFEPGHWQICFQFGTYEYDPGPNTTTPSEDGYRFIWRRPNGQLQGARGQARLMPAWITILLGKAAEEGWYPVPPTSTPPAEIATGDLTDGAQALRWASRAFRNAFRRNLDAADPVPRVPQMQALAEKLAKAAELSADDRVAFLREVIEASDLEIIGQWAKTALGPSFAADEEEMSLRTRFAAIMRRLQAGLGGLRPANPN
jgi:hypothetical protein